MKKTLIPLMGVILVKSVSAFSIANTFSSAKGFASGNIGLIGAIGGAMAIGFLALKMKQHGNLVRQQTMFKSGFATGLNGKGRGLNEFRNRVPILREYTAKRQDERQIEDRLRAAEKQLESYENYLVYQEEALERQILSKEEQIRKLAEIEGQMVKELNILVPEFDNLISTLQRGNRNPQLIQRASEIRNRLSDVLVRMVDVARLMSQQIREQEELEKKEIDEEEQSEKLEEREEAAERQEEGQEIKEEVIDKGAEKFEDRRLGRKTKRARKKANKEIKLTDKEARYARKKEKSSRKAKKLTKKQIEGNERREAILRRIENYTSAAVQNLRNPAVGGRFLKDHLKDINKELKDLFPRKDIVLREAEHIHKLHWKIIDINRRDIRIESKKKRLGEAADRLFMKAERKSEKQLRR